MAQKNILVLNGHPGEASLSRLFATRYAQAAEQAGATVRLRHLSEMDFDMDFGQGSYTRFKPLEQSLEAFMQDLGWADHLVMTAPLWWGGLPAKLKGLFDRAFLPGIAFDTRTRSKLGMPTPMLTGKTARIILTSDTPGWFERLVYRNAVLHQTTKQVLGFVGIKPTRHTWFSGASEATEQTVKGWADKVAALGAQTA